MTLKEISNLRVVIKKTQKIVYAVCAILLFLPFYVHPIPLADAQTATDLQSKITERNQNIQALEKEIQGYQNQLNQLGERADSLASTIKSLDLTQKKLAADIKLTENKITAKNLEIKELSGQISDKEGSIDDTNRIIHSAFNTINQLGEQTPIELILGSKSLSDAWDTLDKFGIVQHDLFDHIDSLHQAKTKLEVNKTTSQKARAELLVLNTQLKDQRAVVLSTAAEKNSLLKQTNQSESSYRQLVAEKQIQQTQLQQEISDYESQLHLNVNASLIPRSGGILSWPLDAVHITQYFGNTDFATANPQGYRGQGHNGIDFRAAVGTPIKSALAGVVSGTGNTGLIRGCYSYGKWVLVKHGNGLSTLYAHMSLQTVSVGQSIATGEILGYSGNTGYTTGPHLHFGVYASDGVRIGPIQNSVHCRGAIIPFADYNAYLNPLSYLPK